MTRRVRVAVVGPGRVAADRARGLAPCGRVEVVGVTPVSPHAARSGEGSGWRPAVQDPRVDAVVLCAGDAVRSEIGLAAIEAGKHVLCDPPIAWDLDTAARLEDAAGHRRVVLFGGLRHRHQRALRRVRQWIDDGALGALIALRCRLTGPPQADAVESDVCRFALDLCGADLVRWLLGSPESVTGLDAAPRSPLGGVLLRDASGRVALVQSHAGAGAPGIVVEVLGREGYACASEASIDGRARAAFGRRDPYGPFREIVEEFAGPDASAVRECEAFAEAIDAADRPAGWAREAIEALRLALAARQSAQMRMAVDVGTSSIASVTSRKADEGCPGPNHFTSS